MSNSMTPLTRSSDAGMRIRTASMAQAQKFVGPGIRVLQRDNLRRYYFMNLPRMRPKRYPPFSPRHKARRVYGTSSRERSSALYKSPITSGDSAISGDIQAAPPTFPSGSVFLTIANSRLRLLSSSITTMSSDVARKFAAQTVNYFSGTSGLVLQLLMSRQQAQSVFSFASE